MSWMQQAGFRLDYRDGGSGRACWSPCAGDATATATASDAATSNTSIRDPSQFDFNSPKGLACARLRDTALEDLPLLLVQMQQALQHPDKRDYILGVRSPAALRDLVRLVRMRLDGRLP